MPGLLLQLHVWLQLTPGRGAMLPETDQLLWEAARVPAGSAVSVGAGYVPEAEVPQHLSLCFSISPGMTPWVLVPTFRCLSDTWFLDYPRGPGHWSRMRKPEVFCGGLRV